MKISIAPAGRWKTESKSSNSHCLPTAPPTHEMRTNQLRLYLSSFVHVLMQALRRIGLTDTALERARYTTIHLKLFKIGAQNRTSVRRLHIAFSDSGS